MITGDTIRAKRNAEKMIGQTACDSIKAASGLYIDHLTLRRIEEGQIAVPEWLTPDMIDWRHLAERIAESKRYRDAGLRTQTEERMAWQETQAWED